MARIAAARRKAIQQRECLGESAKFGVSEISAENDVDRLIEARKQRMPAVHIICS